LETSALDVKITMKRKYQSSNAMEMGETLHFISGQIVFFALITGKDMGFIH